MSTATFVLTPLLAVVMLVTGLQLARLVRGWFESRDSLRAGSEERIRIGLLDDKERLLLSLRDLEFEYEMGKVNDGDYNAMRGRLEQDALRVIGAIEAL